MRMLTLGLAWCAASAVLALAPAVSAQDEPPPPSPSTLVEEVEVIARLPGPALWRVSTPKSQIWFFGLPGTGLPRDFHWDDRRLATALEGARELVLPPSVASGAGGLVNVKADPGHLVRMPPGQTVRSELPPDLKARWEAAARAVGQDPAQYDAWRPVLAARAMEADIAKRDHWNQLGAMIQMGPLANKLHVKMRPLASYNGMQILKLLEATPEAGQTCLRNAADLALAPSRPLESIEAWAKGDFAATRALNGRTGGCLAVVPAVAAMSDRAAADWAKGLKAELARPGKAVVAADLDTLTRKGGLLDQLKAEGLEVIGPAY
jgi:uncharacterized protein YbaP (TraB family)